MIEIILKMTLKDLIFFFIAKRSDNTIEIWSILNEFLESVNFEIFLYLKMIVGLFFPFRR